jgi:hypothetical protein
LLEQAVDLWDMLELKAHAFVEALSILSEMHQLATRDTRWVYADPSNLSFMSMQVDKLVEQLTVLHLRLSIRKAEELKFYLSEGMRVNIPDVIAITMNNLLPNLRDLIVGELEERLIYSVSPRQADYIRAGVTAYGKDVSDKLIDASYDLAEAVKCLGMQRNTACVFHLMRVMEYVVVRIGHALKVTVVDKYNVQLEWGKIIGNIKTPVEAMDKGTERDNWSETMSLLYHVKEAWRNSTMHPKQTYTDEEAVDVFNATKAFLGRLVALI